jgi:hypothetical protein
VEASGPLDASGRAAQTVDGDVAKQWYAAVHNSSGEDNKVFKVFAVCGAGSNATIEATKLQFGEGSAKCPGSKRALGGGVVPRGSRPLESTFTLQASGPIDASGAIATTTDSDVAKQWYASVGQGAYNRVFKLFAICV